MLACAVLLLLQTHGAGDGRICDDLLADVAHSRAVRLDREVGIQCLLRRHLENRLVVVGQTKLLERKLGLVRLEVARHGGGDAMMVSELQLEKQHLIRMLSK